MNESQLCYESSGPISKTCVEPLSWLVVIQIRETPKY